MNFIYQTLLSIGSAILYRLGGSSKADQDAEYPWIPSWFKKIPKKRDGMAGLLSIYALSLLVNAPFWTFFISWGILWGSLSTYYDEVPFNKGKDNYWMHGFLCGLSIFPVAIWGDLSYIDLAVRSIGLGIAMGGWSYLADEVIKFKRSDIVSELGRGGFLTLSNLLVKLF